MKIAAIDFETANAKPASVCAVGISTLEDGAVEDAYYSLIRPEKNVSWFSPMNISVHGILPQDVQDAPPFEEVYKKMMHIFDDAVVTAYNAAFDMGCLKAACLNTGRKVPVIEYFDTLELARRLFPGLSHHRLNDVCRHLHIELDHHQAMSDANGCMMIVVQAMNLTGIYDIYELLRVCNVKLHSL